jgi:hypothetical protein
MVTVLGKKALTSASYGRNDFCALAGVPASTVFVAASAVAGTATAMTADATIAMRVLMVLTLLGVLGGRW